MGPINIPIKEIAVTLAFVAAIIGVIIGVAISTVASDEHYGREARNLLETCEAELPRNQYCELIAVPKEGEK